MPEEGAPQAECVRFDIGLICGDCALLEAIPPEVRQHLGTVSRLSSRAPDLTLEIGSTAGPSDMAAPVVLEFASVNPLGNSNEKANDLNASLAGCALRRAAGEPLLTDIFVASRCL
jgi:hypothetical protein